MWRKHLSTIVILIVICLFFPAVHAMAAPELKVKVSAGFDGKAKYGKGAPITIEIENSGTSPFNGDLVVDTQQSYESGVGEVFPVNVGAGETKTVTFINSKMYDFNMYGMNTKSIFFYEGGWKKGKEIAHKGSQQITVAMYHEDTKILTAFTDNIDRLSALKGMRLTNYPNVQMIDASKITSVKLPDVSAGWGPTDVIIVDEYPIADMSAVEQDALINYVRSGGVIIFGNSDHLAVESGAFAEFLPLTLTDKTTIGPEAFKNWTEIDGFDNDVTISQSTLNTDAKVIYSHGPNILAASKSLGKGMVVQTAFSLGDEPLSKMHGTHTLWKKLLDAVDQSMMAGGIMPYYNDPMESMRWSIGNSNELFPSFKVSAPLLFGVILLYIIIIIPVLYLVLKRKDKREHAWWIIPAISIAVSVFIFAYGARDRIGQAQLQQTSVLDVGTDGTLSGYFVESILTNKAGDFVFTAPRETTLSTYTPFSMGSIFGPSQMSTNAHKRAILERDASGSKMNLRDIGYWDVATVYGQTTLDIKGNYDVNLTVKDKQLTGEITNNFPFPLKDVAIWSGNKQIAIGDLGPGETVKVNETLTTSSLLPKRSVSQVYSSQMPLNTDELMEWRKRGLMVFSGDFINSQSKPAIIGYADTQLIPVNLEEVKASTDALTMITQAFTANIEFSDKFTIDSEMMEMKLTSEKYNAEPYLTGYPANMYYFDEESYIQTWKIPDEWMEKGFNWQSMDISKIQRQLYNVSILNQTTQEFEQLESVRKLTIDSIVPYLSKDGELKLRIEFTNGQRGIEAQAPEIKLHGEVKK
ncbi:hypothetical protein [Sporosarcina highlanderae]|uniref:Uncharacterized protein n=1 Tax=Sporosarcina highlanderae TaxID=3035916 RepID=A0ABT8JUU8_9BACL|nr:hypothetical protein [Sporosarcina highlanderae]MDN4608950.1 hypothetical protein [Sporosarcina highlanderae]